MAPYLIAIGLALVGIYLTWANIRAHRRNPLPDPALRPTTNPLSGSLADALELTAALMILETQPFTPIAPLGRGQESTPEQRRIAQEVIGTELDIDLAEVNRLLVCRPRGLRGLLHDAEIATVALELAVTRAHLRGALIGLDSRLRAVDVSESDRAVATCLNSALRRLPVHHGAVFHRSPRRGASLAAYLPGSLLSEPAFARAERKTFPASGIDDGPLVDFVIWSESGRLTPLLVSHSNTVTFPAASHFRVLAVDPPTANHHSQPENAVVFLAEEPDDRSQPGIPRDQVLEHLREQAATVGVGPIDGPLPSPVAHIGLDERGRPYGARTGRW